MIEIRYYSNAFPHSGAYTAQHQKAFSFNTLLQRFIYLFFYLKYPQISATSLKSTCTFLCRAIPSVIRDLTVRVIIKKKKKSGFGGSWERISAD